MVALALSAVARLDVEALIQAAVKFELYVIVLACVMAICIMSLKAAVFIVTTALHHSFPGVLEYLRQIARQATGIT